MPKDLTVDRDGFLKEIKYILSLSSILFESFQFSGDRISQWMLLTFLLRLQNDSVVSVRELRKDEEVIKFLVRLGLTSLDYAFNKLLDSFGGAHGSFLEIQESRKHDRVATFTPNFHAAAAKYVSIFAEKMGDGKIKWITSVIEKDRTTTLALLKAIIEFQDECYYPAWQSLVRQVAATGENDGLPARSIRDEILAHAPYWSLLLTVWRKRLHDAEVTTNLRGLYRGVYDAMRDPDPREVQSCITFLSNEFGPKILIKDKMRGEEFFFLDGDKYQTVFVQYTRALLELHPRMLAKLEQVRASIRRPNTAAAPRHLKQDAPRT